MAHILFDYVTGLTPAPGQHSRSTAHGLQYLIEVEHPLTPQKLLAAEVQFLIWFQGNSPGRELLEWVAKDPASGRVFARYIATCGRFWIRLRPNAAFCAALARASPVSLSSRTKARGLGERRGARSRAFDAGDWGGEFQNNVPRRCGMEPRDAERGCILGFAGTFFVVAGAARRASDPRRGRGVRIPSGVCSRRPLRPAADSILGRSLQ